MLRQSQARVAAILADINAKSQEAASSGMLDKEKYVIPPHLHDLQEADLPETQRGLVMTEIAQFRERAAKREREKMRDVREAVPVLAAPSGPKQREWGKPQGTDSPSQPPAKVSQGFGKGVQGYSKPVGFVKAEEGASPSGDDRNGAKHKTDEELEAERKEARKRDEDNSYRDVCTFPHHAASLLLTCQLSVNAVMNLESELVYRHWSVHWRASEL